MAPGLGARPEKLYCFNEKRVGEQRFSAQVVLLTTKDAYEGREMPWCDATPKVKMARQEAARLALAELVSTAARPHDAGALAVGLSHATLGGGGGTAAANQPATLPTLSDAMLAVEPVVCFARQSSGVTISASSQAETLGLYDLMFTDLPAGHGGVAAVTSGRQSNSRTEELLDRLLDRIPHNLGQLGEEYASKWLERQPWVAAGSVEWLNKGEEEYGTLLRMLAPYMLCCFFWFFLGVMGDAGAGGRYQFMLTCTSFL